MRIGAILFVIFVLSLIFGYFFIKFFHKPTIYLNQTLCLNDGYANFLFLNPLGKEYNISVKRDDLLLPTSDIDIIYLDANKRISIFAPCTKIGENKKCSFEVSLNKSAWKVEVPCNFEEYFCNDVKRSDCVFNNSLILSNLDSLLWMRKNIPFNSSVIAWWDYGNELKDIANVKPIIINPSSILLEYSVIRKNAIKNVEPQDKVKDIGKFFSTTNESEAVCIAKKYNAKYVYVSNLDLNKFYWIKFAADGVGESYLRATLNEISSTERNFSAPGGIEGQVKFINNEWLTYLKIKSMAIEGWLETIYFENNTIRRSKPQNYVLLNTVAIISKDFKNVFIVKRGLEENMIAKLLILNAYGLTHFKKLYSNNDVNIYFINITNVNC
jgi:hypothetical protein